MWRLSRQLIGRCLYNRQRVRFEGIRALVKQVYIKGHEAEAGVVTRNTRTIFRSESAKFYIFLQLSEEMWHFDQEGDMLHERAIQGLHARTHAYTIGPRLCALSTHVKKTRIWPPLALCSRRRSGYFPELFERWTQDKVSHVTSVVLMSRLYFAVPRPAEDSSDASASASTTPVTPADAPALQWDAVGRCYRDVYKVVTDWESRTDWATLLRTLRTEVHQYRAHVFENVTVAGPDGRAVRPYALSRAAEGNFLEATNLALNVFEKVRVPVRAGGGCGARSPDQKNEDGGTCAPCLRPAELVRVQSHINRDLIRTGLSIMVVTPSYGLFQVDPDLLRLTKVRPRPPTPAGLVVAGDPSPSHTRRTSSFVLCHTRLHTCARQRRMIDNGIGCDLVCMSRRPLHTTPLFQVVSRTDPTEVGSVGRPAVGGSAYR